MSVEGADAGEYLEVKSSMSDARLARNRGVLRERGATVGFGFGDRAPASGTPSTRTCCTGPGRTAPMPARTEQALLQAYTARGRTRLTRLASEAGPDTTETAGAERGPPDRRGARG